MLPYKSLDEFHDRYLHTIIYFQGDPVIINEVYPGPRDEPILSFQRLPYVFDQENTHFKYPGNHPDFTDTPNIGYANAFRRHHFDQEILFGAYLTRIPVRRNKQGLFSENLSMPKLGVSFLDLCYRNGFIDMLKGKYKTFQEIRNLVTTSNKEYGIMGFDVKLALEYNNLQQHVLYHRNDPVAFSLDGGDSFILAKSKCWLRETLEEKGLNVREKHGQ